MSTREITVTVDVDGKQAVYKLKQVDREIENLGDSGEQTGEAVDEAMEEAEAAMRRMADEAEASGDQVSRSMGMAGRSTAEVADEADEARRSMEALGDTDVQASVDLDATEAHRKIEALEQEEVEVDVDTDREMDLSSSSDRGRRSMDLPGPLHEVGEVVSLFSKLPPHVQALIGGVLTASAALAGGAGLAAAATMLADELGDPEIQRDLNHLKMRFRGVGTELSDEFEPVIRNQVIPAAETLADAINRNADALAAFSDRAMELLTGDVEDDAIPESASGASAVDMLTEGRFMTPDSPLGRLFGLDSPLIGQREVQGVASMQEGESMNAKLDLPSDEAMEGVRQKVMSSIVRPAMKEIATIREREDAGLISPEEERKQIKKVRSSLDKDLRMERQKWGPLVFPHSLIDENLETLRQITSEAESLSAAEKVRQGTIDSLAGADSALSQLQTRFNEASTAEARAEYQRLIDKVKEMKEQMKLAAEVEGISAQEVTMEAPQAAGPEEMGTGSLGDDIPGQISPDVDPGAFGTAEQAARSYEEALNSLASSGPQLRSALLAVNRELRNTSDPKKRKALKQIRGKLLNAKDAAEAVDQGVKNIKNSAQQAAVQGFVALGKAIGNNKDIMESFGQAARKILGQLAVSIGKQLIAMGTAQLLANPGKGAAMIAAGTGLVTMGTVMNSGGGGGQGGPQQGRDGANVPEMAEGGTVLSSGTVLVGEEGPEAVDLPAGAQVTPHRETKSMLDGIKMAAEGASSRGGLASAPGTDLSRIEAKLDEVASRFEAKQFRLRGTDQVTQQSRTQAELSDAGIKRE